MNNSLRLVTDYGEQDANLKPTWRIGETELPGNPLRIPIDIHRLLNGNIVHGSTGSQPIPFEVTPPTR
jgi:hypothetical protein